MCYHIYGDAMTDFTLLSENQVFGDENLDILKQYGTKCCITDFAILLGGWENGSYYTSDGQRNTCHWWLNSPVTEEEISYVSMDGSKRDGRPSNYRVGTRVAIPYTQISANVLNEVRGMNGILEVEYGEYPQTVVSNELAISLQRAYSDKLINKTGKSYTTIERPFESETVYDEYIYNGKKYIQINGNDVNFGSFLSNDRMVEKGVYWVEVEPIKWMVDEKANIALSKKALVSGLKYNNVKGFLDKHFSKDIIPSALSPKQLESSDYAESTYAEIEQKKAYIKFQEYKRLADSEYDKYEEYTRRARRALNESDDNRRNMMRDDKRYEEYRYLMRKASVEYDEYSSLAKKAYAEYEEYDSLARRAYAKYQEYAILGNMISQDPGDNALAGFKKI